MQLSVEKNPPKPSFRVANSAWQSGVAAVTAAAVTAAAIAAASTAAAVLMQGAAASAHCAG